MVKQFGGLFLYSSQPKALAKWYQDHLGMQHEASEDETSFYIAYPYVDLETDQERYLAWGIMQSTSVSGSSPNSITINLRVENLEGMLERLAQKNISCSPLEVHSEGKFAWLDDLDGNHIELWEDID